MGLVKKFFWSSVLGGLFMCVSTVMGGPNLVRQLTGMGDLQQQLKQMQEYAADLKSKDLNEMVQTVKEAATGPETAQPATQPVTYELEGQEHQGKKYVFIEGKYYEKREDNIYMVNGRKVYFVQNKRTEMPAAESRPHESVMTANVREPGSVPTAGKIREPGAIPTSASELAESLKEIQATMKDRNALLDDLMQSGPGGH